MPDKRASTEQISEELVALIGTSRQVAPYSSRYPGFDLGQAYEVVACVNATRKARGERPVGRKIGFTNRTVWKGYGISGPIWNYMYDTTVGDLTSDDTFAVANFPELRIEPEIVLHLAAAPRSGMNEDELLGCVDWVAHGFEMVHSIFEDWQFSAADAAAAYGVHSGLRLGARHSIESDRRRWGEMLPNFTIALTGSNGAKREGSGRNVLDGPLTALKFLVSELDRFPGSESLRAGEIITTGTLTEAMPAVAGESWSTEIGGIEIEGIKLKFR